MAAVMSETRTILAHVLFPNPNSENLGHVRAVAEIVDDKLLPVSADTFCPTMKVFITGGYDDLEKRYPLPKLFRLRISPNTNHTEGTEQQLRYTSYVANSTHAEQIQPKEFFEIIKAPLPSANERIVAVAHIPGTRYIFIDDGNDVYGPFQWTQRRDADGEITLDFIESMLPTVEKPPKYHVFCIDRKKVLQKTAACQDGGAPMYILYDLSVANGARLFDYASDTDVLRFIAKMAQDASIKVVEKAKFDSLATLVTKTNPQLNLPFVMQRLARLPGIVNAASQLQTDVVTGITDFLNGENGSSIIQAYIERNKDVYLGELRKTSEATLSQQLSELNEKIKQAQSRIGELDEEKRTLSANVEKVRREAKEAPSLQTEHANVDTALAQKREELADLERRVAERVAHHKLLNTLDDILKRIAEEERDRDRAVARRLDAESNLRDIQRQVHESESELRKRLTDIKLHVDVINGTYAQEEQVTPSLVVPVSSFADDRNLVERQREVVGAVRHALAGNKRPMEEWQIANLLISTQQSFITVFAGLPGVGKTSLARLLAGVQKISNRTKEVSVARGWTSLKDLVGFFNPLTNRFQASNTGLYEFLRALDAEHDTALTQAMAYILLDEANLSPIEHYWSAFMAMADQEGPQALTFGDRTIQIPPNLRFMATINYDGTTEPLSQRVVDRASIILLEPQDFDVDAQIDGNDLNLPISAADMNELFGHETPLPELTAQEFAAFKRVRDILQVPDFEQGKPVQISIRKENAIRQYCHKARAIMGADNEWSLALDMAIKQHVLPHVRGTDRFRKRLEVLQMEMQDSGLKRSAALVKRMIENGDLDLRTYDFFCW